MAGAPRHVCPIACLLQQHGLGLPLWIVLLLAPPSMRLLHHVFWHAVCSTNHI